MSTDPLKGALIGTGEVTAYHLRAWSRIPQAEIVAVADPVLARAQARAMQFGMDPECAFPSLADLLRTGEHQEDAGVDRALHYQFDLAATVIELVGGTVPENWDAVSFAGAFRNGAESGRDYLVVSAGAASFTRSIRFDDYLCIRLYHDGYQCFPNDLLRFDVTEDPHEQHDLAPERPDLVGQALLLLDEWYGQMMHSATHAQDPMWSVIVEGGPQDTRGWLPAYLERLRQTGRSHWAEKLKKKYPNELAVDGGPPIAKQAIYG